MALTEYGGGPHPRQTSSPRGGPVSPVRQTYVPNGGQWRDEEEDDLVQRLSVAQTTPPSSMRLLYDDPIIAVQDSIKRVGGTTAFTYRLGRLQAEWAKLMGPRISASVLVDMARTPTSLGNLLEALRSMAASWDMVRGQRQPAFEAVLQRYLERGVPMLSESAYAQAVKAEVEHTVEPRMRWDPIVAGPRQASAVTIASGGHKVVTPTFRALAYRQYQDWRQATAGLGMDYNGRPIFESHDTYMGRAFRQALGGNIQAFDRALANMPFLELFARESIFGAKEWDDPAIDTEDLAKKAAAYLGAGAGLGIDFSKVQDRVAAYQTNVARAVAGEPRGLTEAEVAASVMGPVSSVPMPGDEAAAREYNAAIERAVQDPGYVHSGIEYILRGLGWLDEQKGKGVITVTEKLKFPVDYEMALMEAMEAKGGVLAWTEEDDVAFKKAWEKKTGLTTDDMYSTWSESWEKAEEWYDENGTLGSYIVSESGLDPAEQPWLCFGAEMFAQTGIDAVGFGGLTAVARGLRIPEMVKSAVTGSGAVQDMAHALAKVKSPSQVVDMLDCTPACALAISKATDATTVTKLLEDYLYEVGGIRGTDLGLARQVAARLKRTSAVDDWPGSIRRMVEEYPEWPLYTYDADINDVVWHVGNAMWVPRDEVRAVADAALAADMTSRVGIVRRLMLARIDKDPAKWNELDVWYKQTKRSATGGGSGTAEVTYAVSPEAKTLEQAKELYMMPEGTKSAYFTRARNAEVARLDYAQQIKNLVGFARRTDPDVRYVELRRLGFTEQELPRIIGGQMTTEQAAALLLERGGAKVPFTLEGATKFIDNTIAVNSADQWDLSRLGQAVDDYHSYFMFQTKARSQYTGSLPVGSVAVRQEVDQMVVDRIIVQSSLQNRGVATRMLSAVLDEAKARGLAVRFDLGDEWSDVLTRLGIPKTEAGHILSPEDVVRMADQTNIRQTEWMVRDALSDRNVTPESVARLRSLTDDAATMEANAANLETYLREVMPTPDDVLGDAELAARQLNESLADSKAFWKELKEQGGISVAGSEYADNFLGASEQNSALRGLQRNVGWDKDGNRIGATVPGIMSGQVKSARRIDDIIAGLPENPLAQRLHIKTADDFFAWLADYRGKPWTTNELLPEYMEAARLQAIEKFGLQDAFDQLEGLVTKLEEAGRDVRLSKEWLGIMSPESAERVTAALGETPFKNLERLVQDPEYLDKTIAAAESRITGLDATIDNLREAATGLDTPIPAPLMTWQMMNHVTFPGNIPIQTVQAHYAGGIIKAMDHFQSSKWNILANDAVATFAKRYMLAAPGTMIKVLGDEPIRAILMGYNPFSVLAGMAGKGRYHRLINEIQQSALSVDGVRQTLRLPIEDAWAVRMPYFEKLRDTGGRAVLLGTDSNWATGMHQWLNYSAPTPMTKAWLLDPTEEGLYQWAKTTEQGRHIMSLMYGQVDDSVVRGWAKALDHQLFGIENKVVRPLSDAETAQWRAWQQAGSQGDPPFFVPPGCTIRGFPDGTGLEPVYIWTRNDMLADMLRGQRRINREDLAKVPQADRPTIVSEAPYTQMLRDAEGNLIKPPRNPVARAYDVIFDVFNWANKNNRKTIYAGEYERRMDMLLELAAVRQVAPDVKRIMAEADRFARRAVLKHTYNSARTGLEYATRNLLFFAPAMRDFLAWYVGASLKNPPIGMAWARMQQMDETPWAEYNVGPFGIDTFIPSLFFWTGGSQAGLTGSDDDDRGVKILSQNFPSGNPFVSLVAGHILDAVPDGVTENLPSLYVANLEVFSPRIVGQVSDVAFADLQQEGVRPLNSRMERVASVVSGVLHGLASGLKDWSSLMPDIPFLTRNPEIYDAMTNDIIRTVATIGRVDMSAPDAAEQLKATATAMLQQSQAIQAVIGLLAPGTSRVRDRELEEINEAMSAYVDTWEKLGPVETELGYDNPVAPFQRERLRAQYPELTANRFFDYVDALNQRDTNTLDEILVTNPEVALFFVSASESIMSAYEAGQVKELGIEPGSYDEWKWAIANKIKWPKKPDSYIGDIAEKYLQIQRYNEGNKLMQDFQVKVEEMGLRPTDAEYQQLKQQVEGEIEARDLRTIPTYQLPALTPFEERQLEEAKASREKRAEELARMRDYELYVLLGDDWETRKSAEPEGQMCLAKWAARFEQEGLNEPVDYLTLQEREQEQLDEYLRTSPFAFSKKEWRDTGLGDYDPRWFDPRDRTSTMVEWLDLRNLTYKRLQELGASWDDSKAEGLRVAYEQEVQKLYQMSLKPETEGGDGGVFARAWNYYQMQPWERLEAWAERTGDSRYQTESWQKLFTALAERDRKVEMGEFAYSKSQAVVAFNMNNPSKTVTPYRDELLALVADLRSDPEFRDTFDPFGRKQKFMGETPDYGFWSYTRRW